MVQICLAGIVSCSSLPAQQSNLPYTVEGDRKVASKRPSDIKQGLALFRAFCSRCHGRDGEGGKGPNLVDGSFRRIETDEQIVDVMVNGISGTGMPGFGPGYEDGYWQVTAYLRDAQRKNEKPPMPQGNVARGYTLFKKLQCASCHWVGGEGGRLGTDLSKLAATPEYVHKSLVDPDSQIDGSYQAISLSMRDGRSKTGRRLYEDSHHILLMSNDSENGLQAVSKDDIVAIKRPGVSLMPSFKTQLKGNDIRDLMTYIFSLQSVTEK